MCRINLIERLTSLSIADRWLLGLCVLPLIFFVLMLYDYSRLVFYHVTHGAAFTRYELYPALWLIVAGFAIIVPIVAALKRRGRLSRILIWLCVLGILEHCLAAINYMRLVGTMAQEGFHWTSEIHVVLRFLAPEVPEGIWIGALRLALWLAIAVLFIRKCRRLKAA